MREDVRTWAARMGVATLVLGTVVACGGGTEAKPVPAAHFT